MDKAKDIHPIVKPIASHCEVHRPPGAGFMPQSLMEDGEFLGIFLGEKSRFSWDSHGIHDGFW